MTNCAPDPLPLHVPRRASSLPDVGSCRGLATLRAYENNSAPDKRTNNAAANNGSCVGRLIQLWHESGEDAAALDTARNVALSEHPRDFPEADFDDCMDFFVRYAGDPRNKGVVVEGSCELEVSVDLAGIKITGHVDQVRRNDDGFLEVWDVKHGKRGGQEMVYGYAWQLALYAVGLTDHYGEDVWPGGILRTRGYRPRKPPPPVECKVFFPALTSLDQARAQLDSAGVLLGQIARGVVPATPGSQCFYCPAQPNTCATEIARVTRSST